MSGPRKRQPRRHSCSSQVPPDYPPASPRDSLYSAWLASRVIPEGGGGLYLAPGARRPLTQKNLYIALEILRQCALTVFELIWSLHPLRAMIMVMLDLARGVFPAFRGYSQALIINEVQTVISSRDYSRLTRLIATELCRVALEGLLDSFATTNENIVQSSARFVIEYRQMEQRVRMDVPTLADPDVRDLFQESELFVRSFSGVSSFGILSPFDFLRVLTLISELVSHIWVLWTLTHGSTQWWLLAFTILSSVSPLLISWWSRQTVYYDDPRHPGEVHAASKQEKMRALAHNDVYRPEIVLFGLGPWILKSWAKARKTMLGLETAQTSVEYDLYTALTSNINLSSLFFALQNVPILLVLQSSSASLGSFTLYRTSVQSLIFSARHLFQTFQMAFQGIFLLGAFSAAMEVKPKLEPTPGTQDKYRSPGKGMKIEARNLTFVYPGSQEPAVKDVSFTLEAGETLAIVGYNGSGKSTLANILLRMVDFNGGELLINGCDIRRYDPSEYHNHVTAVFQGFSKFDASVRQNIGVGYTPEMRSAVAIERAVHLADAERIVNSLPNGLKTRLDASVAQQPYSQAHFPVDNFFQPCSNYQRHGLSGGEWQRIAISRAFMRAHKPEVDLIVLDEPTSSLDPHAQSRVFDTVEQLSRGPTGERKKSVIFITHRLSTARRADKIAMMEKGTITEFGTHQELLRINGSYAALYQASV